MLRKGFLIFLAALFCVSAGAQATQPCVVMKYNKKEAKSPLPGVEVWVNNAGSKTSDENGRLTLLFRTLKPGDKVSNVRATKEGYVIFNAEAVEQWYISRDQMPFTLVLVDKEYFDKLKSALTQTSTDRYKAKYQQATRELEAALLSGKLKEEEYNKKFDELDAQYQEQLKNLDNYIDQFARIDLSEVSAEEQRILELVEQGKIEEAVKAYEDLDIMGKLRQAREAKKAIAEAKSKLESEEARQDEAIAELKARQEREIATLKLAGGKENYEKVGRILKENALADTTDYNAAFAYARFAEGQTDFVEAERFYQLCLRRSPIEDRCCILVLAGNFYRHIHRNSEAETYYLEAVETARAQADMGWLDVAENNLGLLYYETYRFAEAESYYLDCLAYRTREYEQDPSAKNMSSLALTQSNLGFLYTTKADSTKADQYLFSALKNYESATAQSPGEYRSKLADMQIRIAKHYLFYCDGYELDMYSQRDSMMVTKAEHFLRAAVENYRQLYSQEPDKYRGGLSGSLSDLGRIFRFAGEPEKAFPLYQEAFDLNNQRYQNNPSRYRETLAHSNNRMGIISEALKDTVNARKYYSAAFDGFKELYAQSPDLYREHIRVVSKNLCHIFKATGDKENYEKLLKYRIKLADDEYKKGSSNSYQAVYLREELGQLYLELGRSIEAKALFDQIQQIDSKEYASENMADYCKKLAEGCFKKKDFKKAVDYYQAASNYYNAYFQESGEDSVYSDLGDVQWQLGKSYWREKDTVKAESHYLQALEYYAHLSQKDPNDSDYRDDLARAQHNMGVFYDAVGNDRQAEAYYLKSLENDQGLFIQDPEKYRDRLALTQRCLGDTYYNLGENGKAEAYYLQALDNYRVLFEGKPDTYRERLAWVQYSLVFIYSGDDSRIEQYDAMLDAAWTHYEVLYKKDGSHAYYTWVLRSRKGRRALNKGQTDEALRLLESAYELNPEKTAVNLALAYNAKAYEFLKAEDYARALETIERAISMAPEDANYYDSKGEILLTKGDWQGALEMWRKVLELSPDFLSRNKGGTVLYEQLKERGLI